MYFNKKMGKSGGMPFKGNGTDKQSDVPRQYQLNISEPGIKSVGTLRGASASAAPIVAVNKARYDNRQPSKQYEEKTSSQNLTYFLDFRDALKKVTGTDETNVNPTTSLTSLKPISKPVPTHSSPIHASMPLFIQACIDMNYGKDNALYDNTSKTLKFSTPAHGKIQPERKELFGLLMDDLARIEQGQFPVHEEWFDCFGTKMTPSKAHKLRSLLERISRLIGFMLENNTWLGKGSVHMRSIMNALLTKNLLNPKTYQKQKYYSFFYHLTEQSYDDNQGRAIRGEDKPNPLQNASIQTIPFPASYIKDILLAQHQERDAAQMQGYIMAQKSAKASALASINMLHFSHLPFANSDIPAPTPASISGQFITNLPPGSSSSSIAGSSGYYAPSVSSYPSTTTHSSSGSSSSDYHSISTSTSSSRTVYGMPDLSYSDQSQTSPRTIIRRYLDRMDANLTVEITTPSVTRTRNRNANTVVDMDVSTPIRPRPLQSPSPSPSSVVTIILPRGSPWLSPPTASTSRSSSMSMSMSVTPSSRRNIDFNSDIAQSGSDLLTTPQRLENSLSEYMSRYERRINPRTGLPFAVHLSLDDTRGLVLAAYTGANQEQKKILINVMRNYTNSYNAIISSSPGSSSMDDWAAKNAEHVKATKELNNLLTKSEIFASLPDNQRKALRRIAYRLG